MPYTIGTLKAPKGTKILWVFLCAEGLNAADAEINPMSLNNTTATVSIATGETNNFGNVPVAAAFTHLTQSGNTPITNGTGSGQSNHACQIQAIALTTGTTIDLTALTNDGLDGKTRDFSNGGTGYVKSYLIENLDPTNTITITQPGSNGWTGFSGVATTLNITIEPGGYRHAYSPVTGMAVTSSNKDFILTGSAGAPLFKMSLVGIAT